MVLTLIVTSLSNGRVVAASTGKVDVTKKSTGGQVLAGACFLIYKDAGNGTLGAFVSGTSTCDRNDEAPNDGHVTYANIEPGNYVLWEYRSPKGYLVGKLFTFSVTAGKTTKI